MKKISFKQFEETWMGGISGQIGDDNQRAEFEKLEDCIQLKICECSNGIKHKNINYLCPWCGSEIKEVAK